MQPGRVPGGLIVHTYDAEGRLLVEHLVDGFGPGVGSMIRDADRVVDAIAAGHGIALVVWDGDTGERWGTAEYGVLRRRADELRPDLA